MLTCKYTLLDKDKQSIIGEFDTEAQLDDFLIKQDECNNNNQNISDIVFSRSAPNLKAQQILEEQAVISKELEEKRLLWSKAIKNAVDDDSEIILMADPPYIGVTKFLDGRRNNEGDLLTPEFISENYWGNRKSHWTSQIPAGQSIKDMFNAQEIKLLADGNTDEERYQNFLQSRTSNGTYQPLTQQEADNFQKTILKKWAFINTRGTAIHFVMQQYFSPLIGADGKPLTKNGRVFRVFDLTNSPQTLSGVNFPSITDYINRKISTDLKSQMGRKFSPDLITPELLQNALNFAEQFHEHIKKVLGQTEDLDFFPEFKITGDLHTTQGPPKLMGIIDLLVLDNKGVAHIFDYKCSDKKYSDFSEAKKRGFYYQQAIYNRLLNQHGLNTYNNNIRIVPIALDNFRGENIEYTLSDPDKVDFTFDNKLYYPPQMSVNIRPDITSVNSKGESRILDNIDEFLPESTVTNIASDKAVEFVTTMMGRFFPDYSGGKEINEDLIEQEIKDAGGFERDSEGKYSFEVSAYKKLSFDDPKKLLDAVIKERKYQQLRKSQLASTTISALEYAQKNNTKDIQDIIKNIDTRFIQDKNAYQGWFRNYLQKYCNSDWQILSSESARFFGLILLRNTVNNQIDVIKLSASSLKRIRNIDKSNKNVNIDRAFEDDITENQNTNSRILQDAEGNRELIETMLFLNTVPALFSGTYNNGVVGNIEVINPFRGEGIAASNEELLYSLNKLSQHAEWTEANNIANGNIKFGSKWQLFRNELQTALNNSIGFQLSNTEYFQQAQNDIQTTVTGDNNKDAKINILLRVIKGLEDAYNINQLSANQLNSETNLSPAYRLYYDSLITLGELRGLNFRQQLKESAKWIENGLSNILANGIGGIYVDNPGNLISETLNSITKLHTQALQNNRQDMVGPTAKIRDLTERLKKEKNFGYITSLVQNDIDLYKNMYETTANGDLRFVNVNKLSGVEKEYLQYALRLINRDRYPNYTEASLDSMEQNDDIDYYRVPLCRAESRANQRDAGLKEKRNPDTGEMESYSSSLWQSFVDTLKAFSFKNAFKEMQEKINGIFTEDDTAYNNAAKLFDLTTSFDRNEPNASGNLQDRLDNIATKGTGYFEQNLETLTLKHVFAYSTKKRINEIMPTVKAGMAFLINMGNTQNTNFTNDLEYYENYIRNKIKGQPLENDPILGNSKGAQGVKATAAKIRSAASFLALGLNPIQWFYQRLQGIWTDIALIIRKPDGNPAFTFKNMVDAYKTVNKDLFHYSDKPTKCQLINELYGINDMDMNQYADKLRTDKHGLFHINELAFKFTSRPDFYNRMTIILAQMKEQGVWDALEVKDNKLVYNWKKDKRFSAYANNETSNPDYIKQKSLYLAIAQQFVAEGVQNPDGSLFEIGQPLPYAYTNREMESMKSLCDTIYGYYSHEKKSMIHSTFLGSLFMQMRTYWSGKKNQYMLKGGVRLRGHWEQLKDSDGNLLYYQTDADGNLDRDVPPVPKEQVKNQQMLIPFTQWKGQWEEGIVQTFANTLRALHRDDAVDWYNPYTWVYGYNKYLDTLDPSMRATYRQNLRQLWVDLIGTLLLGSLIGGILSEKDKDLIKEAKDSGDLTDAMLASISHIGVRSWVNSAADFNALNNVISPALDWKPYCFQSIGNLAQRTFNTFTGDQSAYNNIINSFSATKAIQPVFTYIAPDGGYIFPQDEDQQ